MAGLIQDIRQCALCVCAGTGTAFGSHLVTCVAMPAVVAGTAGTAMAAALMSASPLVCPPVAAGIVIAADKWRGRPLSWKRAAGTAATAFAVSLLIVAWMGVGVAPQAHAHHHHGAESSSSSTR